jgi:hypothetical protein
MSTGHHFVNNDICAVCSLSKTYTEYFQVSCKARQISKGETKLNTNNAVVVKSSLTPQVALVETLPAGTIVAWPISNEDKYEVAYRGYFIVLAYKDNPARIAAVKLDDGGYLDKGTQVRVIPPDTVFELTTGKRG